MLDMEILDIIKAMQTAKSEINNIEAKAAKEGCPKKLYDTISAFSNKSGGVIIMGVDEENGFEICGVYDAADLQKRVVEQCSQMIPSVRAVFSTLIHDNKAVIAVEIPEASFQDKPVYYSGAGIQKGSYIRVGDADIKMTDKEIYSLMAFKNNIHDELRIVQRADMVDLDSEKIDEYLKMQISKKPNFAKLGKERMLQDLGIIAIDDNGSYKPTVAGLLCFGVYPQSIFPQWMVTCIALPGYEIGEVGGVGERFIDNKKIEGTIPEMIEGSIAFLLKNMSVKTIISGKTGKREDKAEYPSKAIREAVLNALLHRDYSIHSEGIYIQMRIYKNRIEIQNPGGLFGRITIEEIGKKKNYDARNPNLIRILEDMGIVENRGSGIPTMIDEMLNHGLRKPDFDDAHGDFVVAFYGKGERDVIADKTMKSQADLLNNITSNEAINEAINEVINETEKSVIKTILVNSKVTKPQISEMTGLSLSTIDRALFSLKKKGLLARIGSNKKGHWKVSENKGENF